MIRHRRGGASTASDEERHANNLELFLDLVFVFAVTQIASSVAVDVDWTGVGHGALIAFLVWWQWSQYTWAGASYDLQRDPVTRAIVLCTIPATLAMAVAIPDAFADGGRWFGLSYLVVQILVLGMQGAEAVRTAATRAAFARYVSVAAVMPIVVAVGGFLEGSGRTGLWCVAAALNIISAYRGASGEWAINPVHFAERHALFVIISLGEVLVTIGGAANGAGLTGPVFAGLAVAALLASVLWWIYFGYLPAVFERQLRKFEGDKRGVIARDLFTFGHFPIVAAMVGYAIVVKHMVPHPGDAIPASDRWLLAGSIALLIGSILNIQWRIAHHLSRERLIAIPAIVAICAAGDRLDGVVLVAFVAVVLFVMQCLVWRKARADGLVDSKSRSDQLSFE